MAELDLDKLQRSIKACAHHPEHDCNNCEYSNDKLWCFNDELLSDFDKCIETLKGIVHCRECKYAKQISADYLGCSCLIDGIDSDYVMTVKPDSFCSWGERNAE